MIRIPEDGWGADTVDVPGSLPGGDASPAERAFAVPDWDGADQADNPMDAAGSMRERANAVFRRQRSIGTFNRGLDELATGIAEAPDWSDGLERFDRKVEELRQRHAGDLQSSDDRETFARHAEDFAAMQRIGLKRALVERQVSDALVQLDDQLAYYADKVKGADHDVFREIALDSGLRVIDELREAGYLTPEAAEARKTAFLHLAGGTSGEAMTPAEEEHSTNEQLAMGKRRSGRGMPGSQQPPSPPTPTEPGTSHSSERREPTAADPVGRRGRDRELKVDPGTNPPTVIEECAYRGRARGRRHSHRDGQVAGRADEG